MYSEKLKTLKNLYNLYEQYITETGVFTCKKGCATCCTCNVTMTSLETAYLLRHLDKSLKKNFMDNIAAKLSPKRYHPLVTTNGFAALCASGEELPEEENDPLWGKCPLLRDNVCPVYESRPFGCRSLVSERDCAEMGCAQVPDFMLTVNSIFMQFIEHIDASGVSGNLTDMIFAYGDDFAIAFSDQADNHIIRNQEACFLVIPPDHRQRLMPLLTEINAIIK